MHAKGTGKTFLLRQIIETLKEQYKTDDGLDRVAITASTGELTAFLSD